MAMYYPAIVTSAIFFSAIVVNLKNSNYGTVFGLGLLAIPSILFLVYLSQKNMDILAYSLLAIPLIIVIAGYEMGMKNTTPTPTPTPTPTTPTLPTTTTTPPTNNVPPRMEPKEGCVTKCNRCTMTPCMCPYKPPFN